MRIVRKVNQPAGWNKVIKCTGAGNAEGKGCGSHLHIFPEDIYLIRWTERDGSSTGSFTFCCELCGIETDIDSFSGTPMGTRSSEAERMAKRAAWNKSQKQELPS